MITKNELARMRARLEALPEPTDAQGRCPYSQTTDGRVLRCYAPANQHPGHVLLPDLETE